MSLSPFQQNGTLRPQGFKIDTGGLLLSSLGINLLSLALPVMTLQIYDRILPNPGSGTLPVMICGVCIAIILETVLRLGRAWALGWAGAAYEHRMACLAMNHLLQSDLSSPPPYGIGEHLSRIASIGRLKDFHSGYSLVTLFELCFVPLFLGLIVYISGPLAVVPAAVLMAFTCVAFIQGRKFRRSLAMRDHADDERYNFLIESLEGIHSVKSFGLENIFARRYERLEEHSTIANHNVTLRAARSFDTGIVFSNLMVAGVISVGAVLTLHGMISSGALIATILLSGRIMQPLQKALSLWTKYQDFLLSRQKVEGLFDAPLYPAVPAISETVERTGALAFRNVSFRQTDNAPWLLRNVDLSVSPGECVSLQSDHGPSLSALLDMMSGIFTPASGDIVIDGVNSLTLSPQAHADHVGYIQGEGMIFRGTIRDNLTCFGRIDEARVQEMAAIFQIDRDIARLPQGFDTYLNGNATDAIPPGLKQRISMVRVLAPKPRIIVLDNPDRSLDRAGYNLVYNLLARLEGRATVIICSDDKNLISRATRHFGIANGQLRDVTAYGQARPVLREMAS